MRSCMPKCLFAVLIVKGKYFYMTILCYRSAEVASLAVNLCKAGGFVKPHADRLCYIHYGRAALELLYNIILQCNFYHKNYLHYN